MAESTRRPTLEDVAKAAGVSRALVSIVMRGAPGASETTRARVTEVADRLGYQPDVRARLLAKSSTRLLGVVYRIGALHHADVLGPIYDAAEQAGYEVILSGRTGRHDERKAVSTLLGYRCDALVILGPDSPEPDLGRLARSLPVVLVGRRIVHPEGSMDIVRTDEVAGMELAVRHLVGLGHRRIVHVDGEPGTIASDRRRGYRTAMNRAGLQAEIDVVDGEGTIGGGRQAGTAILARKPRPTAVIAFNDEAAWGVMRVLGDGGVRIPDDLSLVGYDGSPLARMAPRELTTIHQDADALGRQAVRLAVGRLEGTGGGVVDKVLEPSLVPGETTAPPHADNS